MEKEELVVLAGYRKVDALDQNFEGKKALIRKSYLKPEFQNIRSRIVTCTGGFGCHPDKTGTAVFVTFDCDGEHARFDRRAIECLLEPCDEVRTPEPVEGVAPCTNRP